LASSVAVAASAERPHGARTASACACSYWGPRRKPEIERECPMEFVELDRLLAESDFVSIHSPLRPGHHHQISTAPACADETHRVSHQTPRAAPSFG